MKALCARLAALFGLVLVPACGAAQTPPARALCYVAADAQAQQRVDAECSIGDAGVPFAECPAHDDILADLRAALKECK